MSNRFPLVLDSDDNKIKELPAGDNLNLQGSGLVNAQSIQSGTITVDSILINNNTLKTVAFTNDFNDLDNTPIGFSGNYNDLTNTPSIPSTTQDLDDVSGIQATEDQALLYDSSTGKFTPKDVVTNIDLSQFNIGELGNVITVGNVTDRFLKFTAGAWRPAKVQYNEVQNKPTNVSFFANDAGYITSSDIQEIQGDFTGSVFSDDSNLLVDGVNGIITAPVDTDSVTNSQGNLTITADNYITIDSTNNGQLEIGRFSGLGNVILGNTSNSTDVQIEGRLFIKGGGVPTTSVGSDGDFEGIFAVDNDYIYYCTATFDGVTNIWKRVAWSGDTW